MKLRDSIETAVPHGMTIGAWGDIKSAAMITLGESLDLSVPSDSLVRVDELDAGSYPTFQIEIRIPVFALPGAASEEKCHPSFVVKEFRLALDYSPNGTAELWIGFNDFYGVYSGLAEDMNRRSSVSEGDFSGDLLSLLTGRVGIVSHQKNENTSTRSLGYELEGKIFIDSGFSDWRLWRKGLVPALHGKMTSETPTFTTINQSLDSIMIAVDSKVSTENIVSVSRRKWNTHASRLT